MEFRELVSPSLTELFIKEMERKILSGELSVGEKLPTEREMAEKMKVSLAVVNGGIRRLSERGFLKIAPRKGVFVADYVRDGNIATLEALMEYSGDYYQKELLSSLVDFRKIVELRATECASINRTEENLKTLKSLLESIQQCQDVSSFCVLAYKFHHEIAVASGNVVHALIVSTFRAVYISSYRAMIGLRGTETIKEFFATAIEHIEKHDTESAVNDVRASIERWEETLQQNYREGQRYR